MKFAVLEENIANVTAGQAADSIDVLSLFYFGFQFGRRFARYEINLTEGNRVEWIKPANEIRRFLDFITAQGSKRAIAVAGTKTVFAFGTACIIEACKSDRQVWRGMVYKS